MVLLPDTNTYFTSNSLRTLNCKNLISKFDKSIVVYHFKCYCEDSYIGQHKDNLEKGLKTTYLYAWKSFRFNGKGKKYVQIMNALKSSAIAENLVNNHICAEILNLDSFLDN